MCGQCVTSMIPDLAGVCNMIYDGVSLSVGQGRLVCRTQQVS
jgi:hypothetical protein